MSGLLTGTLSPSAARYSVVAKSPLTHIWAQSNSGGRWGVDLKQSGFDGIIFEGISEKPVYLVIDDEEVELRDAGDLWGKNVSETRITSYNVCYTKLLRISLRPFTATAFNLLDPITAPSPHRPAAR